jgi:hypothetical protein
MVGQLRSARPRTLKQDIREDDRVQFSEAEVVTVGERMTAYLGDVAAAVGTP